MEPKREFFPLVRKTVMPRPYFAEETDILGQSGTAKAVNVAIFGDNWYLDKENELIEIYGAGAAISFRNLLPNKNKYDKEGLYLRLKLAYRTTENANVNIRSFSGRHLTLSNSVDGHMFDDVDTYWYITDDMTININSIYTDERIWIQRVDWEWMSKEVVFEDEIDERNLFVSRTLKQIEGLYIPQKINQDSIKEFLINKIKKDEHFAKRCLAMLCQDKLMAEKDLIELFQESGIEL
jgi:hypothetical protein